MGETAFTSSGYYIARTWWTGYIDPLLPLTRAEHFCNTDITRVNSPPARRSSKLRLARTNNLILRLNAQLRYIRSFALRLFDVRFLFILSLRFPFYPARDPHLNEYYCLPINLLKRTSSFSKTSSYQHLIASICLKNFAFNSTVTFVQCCTQFMLRKRNFFFTLITVHLLIKTVIINRDN